MNFEVRINRTKSPDAKVKAFATVTIDGLYAVRNIRIVDGEKGLFVSMPSEAYEQDGERKYRDIFFPVSAEARKPLVDAILDAYEKAE